jgi:hypothetical protein
VIQSVATSNEPDFSNIAEKLRTEEGTVTIELVVDQTAWSLMTHTFVQNARMPSDERNSKFRFDHSFKEVVSGRFV